MAETRGFKFEVDGILSTGTKESKTSGLSVTSMELLLDGSDKGGWLGTSEDGAGPLVKSDESKRALSCFRVSSMYLM